MRAMWLAARSLLWAIILPGFLGFYLPWRYFGVGAALRAFDPADPLSLLAAAGIAAGVALLALCIFEFARSGKGTLSPLDPPRHLVVRGLYRYVRNPMYLSVTMLILGQALLARSRGLAIYCVVWLLWVNVFVRFYEEPTLRRDFGPPYEAYTRNVGRWIPRFRT